MPRKKTTTCLLLFIIALVFVLSSPLHMHAREGAFFFRGNMSKEVLRNYVSRAVTSILVMENNQASPIFEEDLRMHLEIGAKYLGRAAYFSWGGNMSKEQVDRHFSEAKIIAEKIHAADPEIILQAGVFEIIYKGTVNGTEIPAFVFEAFNQPVVKRNFNYSDMVFPDDHRYGPGFWGTGPDGAVPMIAGLETQMYFYYNMCRYIDAGFEAVHIGQVEMMMDYKDTEDAKDWDLVLTLVREYAKKNARRGLVLIDAHTSIGSKGLKVGNRLLLDIQGAPLFPNETEIKDGAMMCEVKKYDGDYSFTYIGRSPGGLHPLGFEVKENFMILEFDNYGGNGRPGIATYDAFYVWGYDDITWFALQPEWYRSQFLLEADQYLKSEPSLMDDTGKPVYFLQLPLKRVITEDQKMLYVPEGVLDIDDIMDYLSDESTRFKLIEDPFSFELTVTKDYRANRQSDACPNGSGQEDTIKTIFMDRELFVEEEDLSSDEENSSLSSTPVEAGKKRYEYYILAFIGILALATVVIFVVKKKSSKKSG